MLRSNREKQQAYEFVSIEELVPQDHLLRKVDKYIDFSFIDEKVRPLYCADNGRPAIDPVVLFKMIFLGYFTASVRASTGTRDSDESGIPLVSWSGIDRQSSGPYHH